MAEQETIQKLRELGISPSPQRVAVFDFLRTHPIHPTADTIFREIRKTLPTVSLTTVYNTLKLLNGKRALQEILIEDGELRYDADMRDHAHFKCIRCGKVVDLFPPEGAPLLVKLPPLPENYRITEVQLSVKGFCSDCR